MTLSSFVLLTFAPTKRHPTYSLGYVWLNIVVYEIDSWKNDHIRLKSTNQIFKAR